MSCLGICYVSYISYQTVTDIGSYGFVPTWRLQGDHPDAPPHPMFPNSGTQTRPAPSYDSIMHTSAGALAPAGMANTLSSIFQLPMALASALRTCSRSGASTPDQEPSGAPPPPPKDIPLSPRSPHSPPTPARSQPRRPLTANGPTPTLSPYTWSVPESAAVLGALLALAYPAGSLGLGVPDILPTLELTARVLRAAIGYQAARVVSLARDRLGAFVHASPVEVYATAAFFRFGELGRLASAQAVRVPRAEWSDEARGTMGASAAHRLEALQRKRTEGLKAILAAPLGGEGMGSDHEHGHGHSGMCAGLEALNQSWQAKVLDLEATIQPGSELLELLDMDLGGLQCGACLTLVGQTVHQRILQAKELPSSI